MKTKEATALAIKQRRINRSAEQWRELVWEHRRSGLSLARFCEQVSASTSAFLRWRKQFRDLPAPEGRAKAVQGKAQTGKRDVVTSREDAPHFVEIAAPMRACDGAVKIRLELGGGIVLEVARG